MELFVSAIIYIALLTILVKWNVNKLLMSDDSVVLSDLNGLQ